MSLAFKKYLFLTIFFLGLSSLAESRSKSMPLAEVKSKIADAVLLRQRERALDIVTGELDFISTTSAAVRKDSKKDQLLSLKQNILNQFYSEKVQNAYEEAATNYISNKRKAVKNISDCLEAEPKNIQCLWMDLKIAYFYGDSNFESKALKYIELTKDLPDYKFRIVQLQSKLAMSVEDKIELTEKETKKTFEKKILDLLIQYDAAVADADLDEVKEILNELDKEASDHPDLTVMRAKLNKDQSDFSNKASILRSRCQALSADIIRKYTFDIDFCKRG